MGKKQQIEGHLSNVGKKLSSSEIEKIKNKTGVSGGIRAIAREQDIEIKKSQGSPDYSYENFGEGFTPAVFDYQSALNLLNAQGNIDTQIAGLNAEAAKEVARITGQSSIYSSLVNAFDFS